MGEVQEQRYICKICSKSCASGKSLGGHMRVHLAQISASKKAAKEKAEIKFDDDDDDDQVGSCQLKESSMNQSNSALFSDEKIKNCDSNTDFGDGDQNNSYELRENPKKTWRISDDPKHGVSMNANSCKECGKEFPSLRALSGHMRCHSIKNKKEHHCKKCGKGFDSMRAMFGHMKSHSKKLRVANESTESLSDLENLCPVRRKRSRIRYKSTSNPSFSSIDASNSAVSEIGEAEEAATCLMMLSRGVSDCLKFETETSDDDSIYFGAESSCKSKKFSGYDGDFLSDVNKKMKMSLSTGKLECCSSGYANAFTEKNVCELDDLDSNFVAQDQRKVESEVADDELVSVDNETKVDFMSDDGQPSVHKFLVPEQSYEFAHKLDCADDPRSSDSTKFAELDKDLLVVTDNNVRHKMQGGRFTVYMNPSVVSVTEDGSKLDQLEYSDNQVEQESTSMGTVSLESSKSKERECPICFKVFASGQALGGHKRAHYNGFVESKNQEPMVINQEVAEVQHMLDLNFPVSVDEGTKTDLGLNSWWIDRSREHEALVLTN